MSGQSPSAAVADFIVRLRRAIQCVAVAEVRGSGSKIDRSYDVTLIPRDDPAGNVIPLRSTDGRRDLRIGVYMEYRVRYEAHAGPGERFSIELQRSMYELLDRDGQEIFAYHWHPVGVSPVRFPHLHVSGVVPPTRPGATRIEIGRAHFPTGPIALEDVIGLLIRDFGIVPRRNDWERILTT